MPIVRRTRISKSVGGVCLVVLAAVVWTWDVSSEHSVSDVIRHSRLSRIIAHTVPTAYVPGPHDLSQHNQANTTRSLKDFSSPDDGHNDARNMLRVS
jgi:hypothetical protein